MSSLLRTILSIKSFVFTYLKTLFCFLGWTPLHEACIYGWYQVVIVLVKGGANVNAKGLDDDTPLHDATTSGNLKMVKFLVEHGADPFVKNAKAKMPIDYAAPHIYEFLESLKGMLVYFF